MKSQIYIDTITEPVRALTVKQPYAGLLTLGYKGYETRSWKTNYRGPIAIHAGQSIEESLKAEHLWWDPLIQKVKLRELMEYQVRGAIVAVGELTDIYHISCQDKKIFARWLSPDGCLGPVDTVFTPSEQELMLGNWNNGSYAWKIQNVKILRCPITARGQQGLWTYTPEV